MEATDHELRTIVILGGFPQAGKEGFFHGWCKEPFFNDTGGYITKTYALVEFTTGVVQLMDPNSIKFKRPPKEELTSAS